MSSLFRSAPTRFTKAVVPVGPATQSAFRPIHVDDSVQLTKDRPSHPITAHSMSNALDTKSSGLFSTVKSCKGLTNSHQVRFAHTDVAFPDMETYRRESTKDTTKPARDSEDARRAFTYLHHGGAAVLGLYVGKNVVRTVVDYKSMARDQLALASVEIDLSKIGEGDSKTFEWRGKPVFVRHRTQDQIAKERTVNMAELRHPQSDEERVKGDPKWVVTIGVCTHLGCVPIANQGDYSGYYCPCHGSHYDTAGRIRKGPAPENLEVPEYSFINEGLIKVGA